MEAAGIDTSREALALDVIKAVGPRSHYLGQRHTRDHMRRRVLSDVANQSSPSGGMRDPIEVAREKAEWILNNHHPQPLEPNQQKELTRILEGADQDACAGGRE
jgi:trimethylamine--corrinoid protein Co-methyltransferase